MGIRIDYKGQDSLELKPAKLKNVGYKYKIWLDYMGRPLLGKGRYMLLRCIDQTGSLKKSAEACGLSYKTAYNYIKRIESRLKQKIIVTSKGGKDAGGSTTLNPFGKELLKKYEDAVVSIK
ncbi:LysR family transcriptional regulator [Candidatus Woesearchaeota archaeon]|nr:LysR family transcriptional regulator [Candidatus Woesearchaeota archaeon]